MRSSDRRQGGFARRHGGAVAAVAALALAAVPAASAHVERPSYWPDPAADGDVAPAAGGEIPAARDLETAIGGPDELRVVCKRSSLDEAKASIRKAKRDGYKVRPSDERANLTTEEARELRGLNKELFELCEYRNIQAAVNDSGNNDRVVVMPGRYIEKPSRRAPFNDPACDQFELPDSSVSYEYQVNCPNDQSLIFVQGRELGDSDPPDPPLEDRHGIPDEGDCARCNLQIEGSGVRPNDVLVDAARRPGKTKLRELGKPVKDVGIRVDRADGFVLRNMTFAHALEHGVYVIETDGFLLDRTKYFYNGQYGALVFQTDHGLIDTCEGMGHGDSAVYPGASADTGEDATAFYPDAPRISNTITNCDIHHNTLGYSGTMGNATRVTENNFWDNGTAITTDSLGAGGHPGFPQDSARFDHNDIWSNNFNSFRKRSDVVPRVPVPVGVGIFIPGGNNNEIDNNRIWDNWRRGTMLLTLPDSQPFGFGDQQLPDDTSHRNRYHDNLLGEDPDGGAAPNGTDFWWDEARWEDASNPGSFYGAEDNCWFDNGEYTSDPPPPDTPGTAPPGRLPEDCDNESAGVTYQAKILNELLPCFTAAQSGNFDPNGPCTWFSTPPSPTAARQQAARPVGADGAPLPPLRFGCELVGDTQSCEAFAGRP